MTLHLDMIFFRQLPYFGIYVIMFFDILKTVLKLSVILVVFLVAFGLGFNLLLAQHVGFYIKFIKFFDKKYQKGSKNLPFDPPPSPYLKNQNLFLCVFGKISYYLFMCNNQFFIYFPTPEISCFLPSKLIKT